MIVTDDDCCKLILEETNLHEKKAGYIIKFKQLCDEDGLENYWCLTNKELKELVNYLVKAL